MTGSCWKKSGNCAVFRKLREQKPKPFATVSAIERTSEAAINNSACGSNE